MHHSIIMTMPVIPELVRPLAALLPFLLVMVVRQGPILVA